MSRSGGFYVSVVSAGGPASAGSFRVTGPGWPMGALPPLSEVLCKVIAHNLWVLIACIHELGLPVPEFGCVDLT